MLMQSRIGFGQLNQARPTKQGFKLEKIARLAAGADQVLKYQEGSTQNQ